MQYRIFNASQEVIGSVNAPTGDIAYTLAQDQFPGVGGIHVIVDPTSQEVAACFRRMVRSVAEVMDRRTSNQKPE